MANDSQLAILVAQDICMVVFGCIWLYQRFQAGSLSWTTPRWSSLNHRAHPPSESPKVSQSAPTLLRLTSEDRWHAAADVWGAVFGGTRVCVCEPICGIGGVMWKKDPRGVPQADHWKRYGELWWHGTSMIASWKMYQGGFKMFVQLEVTQLDGCFIHRKFDQDLACSRWCHFHDQSNHVDEVAWTLYTMSNI